MWLLKQRVSIAPYIKSECEENQNIFDCSCVPVLFIYFGMGIETLWLLWQFCSCDYGHTPLEVSLSMLTIEGLQ